MKLVIHAHALRNEPLSQAITGHFDERGGTIGRSDTNTLTLPDPERHVSRLQAEVLFAAQAFSIRNVGSANSIELNGHTLQPGEGAPLAAGDQLIIGGYAMRVVAETQAAAAGTARARPMDSRTVIRASAGEAKTGPPPVLALDPFADLASGSAAASSADASADPFADLMGAAPATATAPAPVPVPLARSVKAPASAGRGRPSTDDFDPFADLAPTPQGSPGDALSDFMAPPPAAPAPSARDRPRQDVGMDDLLGLSPAGVGVGAASSSLDAVFGLGGAGGEDGADLLDDFLAPPKPAPGSQAGDVLDLFADRPADPTAAKRPAAFNHTPALAAAYVPPAIKAAPAAAKPAPAPGVPTPKAVVAAELPRPKSGGAATSPQALWEAFCEGAGISLQLPQELNPQMMRVMGQLLHHAVEGSLKLVAARASTKYELRAQVTTIQSKHNNPLKFSVDTQAALSQLLQPPMRGFMPGPDAVDEVMDDLLGHHIGTMAGMRAALQGVLQRFEPAQLEGRLSGKGVIDTLLPMHRRARLWELYVEHYRQVQDDAQDDFHELFGKAFVQAYEQQLDRLQASRGKAG